MRRWMRRLGRLIAGVAALALLMSLAVYWIAGTDWAREQVRARIVSEVERVTGGKVTLGEFRFHESWLVADLRRFQLRGKEPATEAPLFEADSIRAGFRIVSLFQKRVDLVSLSLLRPRVHLIVNADGTTNLPEPRIRRTGKPVLETLLDLRVGSFLVRGGIVEFADRRIPLEASGRELTLALAYRTHRYQGKLRMAPLILRFEGRKPLETVAETGFIMEPNRLAFPQLSIDSTAAKVRGSAEIPDFRALTVFASLNADVEAKPLGDWLNFERLRGGSASAKAQVRFRSASDFSIAGDWTGSNLQVTVPQATPGPFDARSKLDFSPDGLKLEDLQVNALGGAFDGTARLGRNRFEVEGAAGNLKVARVLEALKQVPDSTRRITANWSGAAKGPIRVAGNFSRVETASGRIEIVPEDGARPVSGLLDVAYQAGRDAFEFEPSYLTAGRTRIELSGNPAGQASVRLESRDLTDLDPLVNLAAYGLTLNGGRAQFQGVVSGGWKQPRVNGSLEASQFIYRDVKIDAARGAVEVDHTNLRVRGGAVRVGGSNANVDGFVALDNWRASDTSALNVSLNTDAALSQVIKLAGSDLPLQGRLSARLRIAGTPAMPQVNGAASIANGEVYGEKFDRASVTLVSANGRVEAREGILASPAGKVQFSGSYEHDRSDYRTGQARFEVITAGIDLERLHAFRPLKNVAAALSAHLAGAARLENGRPQLERLEGNAQLSRIRYEERPAGNVIVAFAGTGQRIDTRIDARLGGSRLAGNGSFGIEPGYPGELQARLQVPSIAAVRGVFEGTPSAGSLDFDGSASGTLRIGGKAADAGSWQGSLSIPGFRIYPVVKEPAATPSDRFTLRNEGPLELTLANSTVRLARARVVGTATNLELEGALALNQKRGLDVRVKGGLDMGVVGEFSDGLTGSGTLLVNASVNGTLTQPAINGRLEMHQASLGLDDSPAGLSNVEATIVFNNREATIQKLTAAAGGGTLEATGFVERLPNDLAFRLAAKARQVRIRYPEGVSSTSDADVTWAGTTTSSLVSGSVTVLRAGFNPRSDLSSMLAASAEPVRTPSARSGLAAGIQFDVIVNSAPNLLVESALTQDIQAEADLRLRGTAFNPVLLGRIAITQGEVTFFGTRYTINQGTIDFLNPVRLEPTLNLDMETRVRGIDVILTFTGPINKLRITHRADPPLQFSEVVQLLATGRAPTSDPSLSALQASRSAAVSQLGGSALLGQAIATPVSNRLQRFFGVSRLKIDPNLTGVDNRPQARVTIEQQVTKNITFTYITDVQRSNQQIVRMEWSVNRNYSVLVVREENGVLGVDMLYRKGFR